MDDVSIKIGGRYELKNEGPDCCAVLDAGILIARFYRLPEAGHPNSDAQAYVDTLLGNGLVTPSDLVEWAEENDHTLDYDDAAQFIKDRKIPCTSIDAARDAFELLIEETTDVSSAHPFGNRT